MRRVTSMLAAAMACLAPGAAAVTFTDVCVGVTLRQTVAGVEMFCPGQTKPWLILDACYQATASRDRTTGRITVKCGPGSKFAVLFEPKK